MLLLGLGVQGWPLCSLGDASLPDSVVALFSYSSASLDSISLHLLLLRLARHSSPTSPFLRVASWRQTVL